MTTVVDDKKIVGGIVLLDELPDFVLEVDLWTLLVFEMESQETRFVSEAFFKELFELSNLGLSASDQENLSSTVVNRVDNCWITVWKYREKSECRENQIVIESEK